MPNGTLYIVSTPIGNLEDITIRALRILKEADIIAAEDTRHSLKILNHYGIRKQIISYWGEKEKEKAEEILSRLKNGRTVALISDAGTPCISDPGTVLVRRAAEEGIRVESVPGPSAVISALAISGLPADEFIFCGFLPSKQLQRRKTLERLSIEEKTLVFYEAPHRIIDTLRDISLLMKRRRIVVIKELTKLHESIWRGTVNEVMKRLEASKIAGEYVIVLEGKTDKGHIDISDALAEIKELMKKGLGRKEAVIRIAETYGLSKKELYDRSLGHGT